MARRRNPLLLWLNTTVLLGFCRVTGLLPLPVCRSLGRWSGRLAYYVVPKIRQIGLANLDLAYGDTRTPAEKRRIVRRCAESVGITAAEFSRIPQIQGEFLRRHVTIEGVEHLDREQGVLVIGAHLGNWEWLAPVISTFWVGVAGVTQEIRDPRLNRFVDHMRQSPNVVTLPKDGCGPEIIRYLKEGWLVGMLVDQSPRRNGVPVEFFGQPCWGTIGAAMIAARTQVPVHAMSFTRDGTGHYTLRFGPPLEFTWTGELRTDLQVNSQRCQDAVEEVIRAHPDQWLWFHRRWKPRPRLEEEWKARMEAGNGDGEARP